MTTFAVPQFSLPPSSKPLCLREYPPNFTTARKFARIVHRLPNRFALDAVSVDNEGGQLPSPYRKLNKDDEDKSEAAILKRICDYVFPEETDWKKFWETDDYEDWYDKWADALTKEAGFDVTDPNWKPTEEHQMEWLYRAVPHLAESRKEFAQFLPLNWKKHLSEPQESELIRPERNPELSVWDLRAMMEMRRAKEKRQKAWHRRMAEVGKYRYLDLMKTDIRITEEERAQYTTWSKEDIWNLITQNGEAADPREMTEAYVEEDPDGPCDDAIPYQDEIDDWLRKEGRLMEPDSDLDVNREITLLSSEFKDFEQAVGEME